MASKSNTSKTSSKRPGNKTRKRRLGFLPRLSSAKRNGLLFVVIFAFIGSGYLLYSFALAPGAILDVGNGRACETLEAHDVTEHTAKAHDTLKDVPNIGQACALPNGLYKVSVGSNGQFSLTHGRDSKDELGVDNVKVDHSDPKNPVTSATANGDSVTAGRTIHLRNQNVHCTSNDYRNVVIYAHAANVPDRLNSIYLYIYQAIQTANGMLDWEAGTMGGAAAFNLECANGQPNIHDIATVATPNSYSYSNIYNDVVNNHHFNDLRKHYWIFVDDGFLGSNPGGGTAQLWPDSRPIDNLNNGNAPFMPSIAVTWDNGGIGGGVMLLHEVGHMMGNVQDANHSNPAAPDYYSYGPTNSGGNFHASEVGDVMSYPTSAPVQQCVGEIRFDCNHDTYFNLHPPTGSWVSNYWQAGSPRNHYLYITY